MQYQQENPGWIISETMLGGVTVVSMQTPFMVEQLHDEALQVDGPFNGVTSDAAHGWWQVHNSLLLVSSVFCVLLQSWVPVLNSYLNGATSSHFKHHFLALLESIACIAIEQGKVVSGSLFANVG